MKKSDPLSKIEIPKSPLQLPSGPDLSPLPRNLSMDEYLKFVEFALQQIPDRKEFNRLRDLDLPTARFVIKA